MCACVLKSASCQLHHTHESDGHFKFVVVSDVKLTWKRMLKLRKLITSECGTLLCKTTPH